ncbi:MAG TPA: hypothetical protein VN687_08235 [Blastocatellia bacterium]|nr:hypothetical protein [Blastocatellia bacterium]
MAVWDRDGDTLYDTLLKFEFSRTSTVAVAPLGTELPVAIDTVRFEEAFCAAIVVGEKTAPPIPTEVADWKANTFTGSCVPMPDRAIISSRTKANQTLIIEVVLLCAFGLSPITFVTGWVDG